MNHTHTFPCGIRATAHDSLGDEFLTRMLTGREQYHFPGIKNLPPDFSVHLDPMREWADKSFADKWRQVVNAMIANGYEHIQYRDNWSFEDRHRFRWPKPGRPKRERVNLFA